MKGINKQLILIFSIVVMILLIPLIAMQFTNEVDWDWRDFLIIGTLLSVTGLGINFVLNRVKSLRGRILLSAAILFTLFLIWAELAVGIFGSPFAGS